MKRTIYLAGGCFWGTAHLFSLVPGVTETTAGYANSRVANPSYEQVCTGTTGAAETVRVTYDDNIVGLTTLLQLYFKSINPVSVNRQGATAASSTAPESTIRIPPTPSLWQRNSPHCSAVTPSRLPLSRDR